MINPFRCFKRTLLPIPLLPIIATASPSLILKDISFKIF
tara:strand:+ start:78 stop:194 length:117 start_codon:yes stop_codon:yes gene_type:complete